MYAAAAPVQLPLGPNYGITCMYAEPGSGFAVGVAQPFGAHTYSTAFTVNVRCVQGLLMNSRFPHAL